jgi:hypothetical protein
VASAGRRQRAAQLPSRTARGGDHPEVIGGCSNGLKRCAPSILTGGIIPGCSALTTQQTPSFRPPAHKNLLHSCLP